MMLLHACSTASHAHATAIILRSYLTFGSSRQKHMQRERIFFSKSITIVKFCKDNFINRDAYKNTNHYMFLTYA